jgi:biotin transport system substrate-specific component
MNTAYYPQTPLQKLWLKNTHQSQLSFLAKICFLVCGVILLSALAQLSIHLPFTPIPITGQSYGVLLIALCFGSRLGTATTLTYILLGLGGLPVFADFKSGFAFPSFGYLLGMLAATYVVGILADRNWASSFFKSLLASLIGKFFIFAGGLVVLSFIVPREKLLLIGFYPFVPGLIIKSILAALSVKALSLFSSR